MKIILNIFISNNNHNSSRNNNNNNNTHIITRMNKIEYFNRIKYFTMYLKYSVWYTIKESVDDHLDSIIRTTPVSDKLVVFVDFNARVGRDHCTWKSILGNHGIGNCNTNGHLLLSACAELNLTVTNTCSHSRTDTKQHDSTQDPSTGTSLTIPSFDLGTKGMSTSLVPCLERMIAGQTSAFASHDIYSLTTHASSCRQASPTLWICKAPGPLNIGAISIIRWKLPYRLIAQRKMDNPARFNDISSRFQKRKNEDCLDKHQEEIDELINQ